MIETKSTAAVLALNLLRLLQSKLSMLKGADLDKAKQDIPKLAQGLSRFPIEQGEVVKIAAKNLGLERSIMKRTMKEVQRKMVVEAVSEELGGNQAKVINLGEQPGTWTRRVLEIIGPETYLYGGNLCELRDGEFVPHSSDSLVARVDAPTCCRFVRPGRGGEIVSTHLTEKDTRILIGALRQMVMSSNR